MRNTHEKDRTWVIGVITGGVDDQTTVVDAEMSLKSVVVRIVGIAIDGEYMRIGSTKPFTQVQLSLHNVSCATLAAKQ